jgi:catechol 2,3-dioxygenase-like lactoylglutathione lyase family enzyme
MTLLHHIGLTVPDLDAATQFLTEALGCEHMFTSPPGAPMPTDRAARLNLPAGVTCEGIAMLRAGNCFIELFAYSAPGQSSTFPRNCDAGGSHLAFAVASIEALRPRIEALGGRFCADPVLATTSGFAGLRWVYFTTPWGQTLELVETDGAPQLRLPAKGTALEGEDHDQHVRTARGWRIAHPALKMLASEGDFGVSIHPLPRTPPDPGWTPPRAAELGNPETSR